MTGRRRCGGVWSTDISRRPLIDSESERGIGVAESISISTPGKAFFMWSLCMTPKRCSSSDDDEAEVLEFYVVCEQPVRPDDYVDLAVGEVRQYLPLTRGGDEARDCLDAHAGVGEARGKCFVMLVCEQSRRGHYRRLPACECRLAGRAYRHFGLSETDVADD